MPRHSRLYEQPGYLVSGQMKSMIGDEVFDAESGDRWNITGHIEHGIDFLADSVDVEVFFSGEGRVSSLKQNLAWEHRRTPKSKSAGKELNRS